ncbi:MAG: PspC domain-containing protein [Dehalococcoidia bacterium]|nr:MAG: PspC domain-containing protein [Dehalococcoidia bacterium]
MQGPTPRRLTRSADRRLGGVCGGIADYFALDPTLVRVVAVILLLVGPVGGMTFLGYIVLWIVLPESPAAEARPSLARDRGDTGFIVGVGLLALGAWLLVNRMGWLGMGWGLGWMHGGWSPGFASGPLLLILVGLVVLMLSRRRTPQ